MTGVRRPLLTTLVLGLVVSASGRTGSVDPGDPPLHFIYFGLERGTPAIAGAQLKYTFEDDDETRPKTAGWVARRWDPTVRGRFSDLFLALAKEFDGRIAGINLPETSIGFGRSGNYHPAGYSYDAYLESILDLMSSARRAFRESDVIIYANFMPGEELPSRDHGYLRSVYEHADRIGAGVGGPDLLPHRWFQRQNSLPLIAQRAPGTVAGVAVQYGNLDDVNRETGERVNVEELVRFATDELHLDYIFWGTQEPHLTAEIYPYLQALPCSNDCSQEDVASDASGPRGAAGRGIRLGG